MGRGDSVVGNWGGDTNDLLELEQSLGAEFLIKRFVRRLFKDFHTRFEFSVAGAPGRAMPRTYAYARYMTRDT